MEIVPPTGPWLGKDYFIFRPTDVEGPLFCCCPFYFTSNAETVQRPRQIMPEVGSCAELETISTALDIVPQFLYSLDF